MHRTGSSGIASKEFAFSGRLSALRREEAIDLVHKAGGIVVPTPGTGTSYVVVGDGGAPLDGKGALTRNLERAHELVEQGARISLLSEEGFLRLVGPQGSTSALYTSAQLARALGVPVTQIRRWVRAGLVEPVECTHRLAYFDFHQVARAKTLSDLIVAGVSTRSIRESLERVARWLPGTDASLAQLAVLERDGELLIRLEDGGLAEPTGQLRLEFDGDLPAGRVVTAAPAPGDAPREVRSQSERQAARVQHERGVLLEERGTLAAAADAYEQSLALGGPDAETCFNLGNVLYQLRRPADAARRFLEAIEIEPDYLEAWNNLANLLAELGDPVRAISAYEHALHMDPRYADAHYNLAETLHQSRRTAAARAHWERYLALDPFTSWSHKVRARLEETR